MTKHSAEDAPKKAEGAKKNTWYPTIIDLGRKGVKDRTIAVRLGITFTEFQGLLETFPQVKQALELARAEHEIICREAIYQVITNPDENSSVRTKNAREDLREMAEAEAGNNVSAGFAGYDIRIIKRTDDADSEE